ncbi:alpha/beta fold hydrolase [candidate division CSSED10-310 bacterium]|uniref:Alpha/beta fold hydrolase n=1 Tax=candidate division CSSED10-310 bacterium TaxID=2855610 RepID=A0ABV6Z3D6_UNCC1
MVTRKKLNEKIYHRFDEGPAPVTAVFVHGAGGSHAVWTYQFDVFNDILPCIFLDLPGHGQSSGDSKNSIREYSECLQEFLELQSIENPLLIGHSMGSAIILQTALVLDNVMGLVFVGGGARLKVAPVILEMITSNFSRATQTIAKNLFASSTLDSFFRLVEQDMIACGQIGLLNDFSACNQFDAMDKLATLSIPSLAIVGAKDAMTPPKYSHFLAEHIEDCQLEIIAAAGHMVMAEQPAAFNEILSRFFRVQGQQVS